MKGYSFMATVNIEQVWRDRKVMEKCMNEVRMQLYLEKRRFVSKFHTHEYTVYDNDGKLLMKYQAGASGPDITD
jgi:hypothetical protein